MTKEEMLKKEQEMNKAINRKCQLFKLLGWVLCAALVVGVIVLMKLGMDKKISMLVATISVVVAFIGILYVVKTISDKVASIRKKGKEKTDRLEDENFKGFSLRG